MLVPSRRRAQVPHARPRWPRAGAIRAASVACQGHGATASCAHPTRPVLRAQELVGSRLCVMLALHRANFARVSVAFVPVAVALALLAPCALLLALCSRRKRLSHGTLGCYIADKVFAFDSADNSQSVLSSPRCLDVSMSRCLLDRRCVGFHCTCAQQPSCCFRCCAGLPWLLRTAAQVDQHNT